MKAPEDLRIWIGGGVAASVLLLAGGWFLLVSPELSTVPALHDETASAQTQNAVLQSKVTALKRQSAQMATLVSELRTVRTELPITAQLPAVIDQLDAQAHTAKVGITSFSIGSVTAVTGATAGATDSGTTESGTTDSGTTDSGTTDSGTTGSGTTGSSATPTPGASAATTTSTPLTASGAGVAGQLFQIKLTIITSGPLRQQEAFLNAVQYGGDRAALVSSTQLGAGQGSESTAIGLTSSMTTELAVFVAPQTPAVAAQLAKQLSTRSSK